VPKIYLGTPSGWMMLLNLDIKLTYLYPYMLTDPGRRIVVPVRTKKQQSEVDQVARRQISAHCRLD
jgi:hypothetical protein